MTHLFMYNDISSDRGLVFNIQRFSIHDGPGIRTTVFLKGCPMHCSWCSNPESIASSPEVVFRDSKCIRCGRCVAACGEQAIVMVDNTRTIRRERCNNCAQCALACPARAIELVGQYLAVEAIMETVMRDMGYYRRTGGGLTVSGGEPLAQWRFARALLQEAKRRGLHTALDTTGHADWAAFSDVVGFADLVLYDVKHVDSELHSSATGVTNDRILENLSRTLAHSDAEVWIRIPVVPGFNDSDEAIDRICRFVAGLPRPPAKVSLLPFHNLATGKYRALGRAYNWQDVQPPGTRQMTLFKRLVESHGFSVGIGN